MRFYGWDWDLQTEEQLKNGGFRLESDNGNGKYQTLFQDLCIVEASP